ncbi:MULTISPECIES: hypothetical protein [Paracoccus]|uniref:Uncharacterized protein n=1 Tax=Paracoccus haeundaensis TaxID=225362 RepID=A0A5C4R460_9RHOB|nr:MULTISPECIES: hypothetical protein [Paracoccus]AZY95591.1 hypothetical protein EOJ32_17530 [Paracoccus sp. Arc7-R13]TNH38618.1 hypothetical protein FHD67_14280 [Paracoccus haeundaensis]
MTIKRYVSYVWKTISRSSPTETFFHIRASVKQPAQGKVDFRFDHPLDLLLFATFLLDLLKPQKDRPRL